MPATSLSGGRAAGVMSLAGVIIAAVLAWCLARSPGAVLALVAAVVWG